MWFLLLLGEWGRYVDQRVLVFTLTSVLCCRWLLIMYKREFWFTDLLRVWEALLSKVRGDQLHICMAVGILGRCKGAIMGQQMGFDDILRFVNDLSSKMDWRDCLADADAVYVRYTKAIKLSAKEG